MYQLPYLKKVQTDIAPALDQDGVVYNVKLDKLVFVSGDENFTLWFTHLIPVIKRIRHLSDLKVLYWISSNLSLDEGLICLNNHFKGRIEEEFQISQSSINRSIKKFKLYKVLIPISAKNRSAHFYVNPTFLWRGKQSTRIKQQKFILSEIRKNEMPDLERQKEFDVRRYNEVMKNNVKGFNFSKVKSARYSKN